MRVQDDSPFRRRLDWNGIYISVCMTCLQTVATSYRNAALAEEEVQHVCHEPMASENKARGQMSLASQGEQCREGNSTPVVLPRGGFYRKPVFHSMRSRSCFKKKRIRVVEYESIS